MKLLSVDLRVCGALAMGDLLTYALHFAAPEREIFRGYEIWGW